MMLVSLQDVEIVWLDISANGNLICIQFRDITSECLSGRKHREEMTGNLEM